MHIIYSKTQYGILLISILSISILSLTLTHWLQIGNHSIPLVPTLIIITVLIIALLLSFKLTITVDDEKISAVFGIGLIKRSMLLKGMDFQSIEEVKVPWYYGIGIRITPKGILYNVKTGNAIFIKSQNKIFFVGTHDYKNIKSALLQLS